MTKNKSTNFKSFYFEKKDKTNFENIFEKFYKNGHWGDIEKDKIKSQQFDWYLKLKKMIEEKDWESLFMSVENRDYRVSREIVSNLININIRKKAGKIIKKKLQDFFLNNENKEKNK